MASVTVESATSQRPHQNWIVDPVSDVFFIIGAPIFAFVWALLTLRTFGPEMVWSIFIIFNVGHHFPTFIRIYGDKDLFHRFRWSLILGPLVPFTVGLLLSYYTLKNGYPLQTLFLMMMVLTLWDPWHFLMQHYGFMRIYDRHNAAPKRLAAWMDYSISLTWFAFIMLATGEWLFEGLLHTLLTSSGVPILLWINPDVYHAMLNVALGAAVLASVVYLGYLVWCFRHGYFVSPAKLSLLVVTFGMMYITYVPTSYLRTNYPDWQFSTGFATLGMVHVTQYLAIVWKFNRGLAKRGEERSRSGIFSYVFSKGGLLIAVGYVAICLVYGSLVSSEPLLKAQATAEQSFNPISIMTCLIVCVGFTSTIMHYYYDGFIWKLRHKENSENLNDEATVDSRSGGSWWERIGKTSLWSKFNADTPVATVVRQACYFGIPLGILTFLFFYVGYTDRDAGHNPPTLEGLRRIVEKYQENPSPENLSTAQSLVQNIDTQIQAEEKMIALNPVKRVGHEVELAYLTFARAWGKIIFEVRPIRLPTPEDIANYRSEVQKAISLLEKNFDPDAEPVSEMQVEMLSRWQEWKQELELTAP